VGNCGTLHTQKYFTDVTQNHHTENAQNDTVGKNKKRISSFVKNRKDYGGFQPFLKKKIKGLQQKQQFENRRAKGSFQLLGYG